MGDQGGFDDQFDNGMFRSNLRNGVNRRPQAWPKSVSGMRGMSLYEGQNMPLGGEAAHSEFIGRRPLAYQVRPATRK